MKCIVGKIKIKVQYGIILLLANPLNLHLIFAPYKILNLLSCQLILASIGKEL